MLFSKGELIFVRSNERGEQCKLCVVVANTIACVAQLDEFFMVYSIAEKQKFITTKQFMQKVVDKR